MSNPLLSRGLKSASELAEKRAHGARLFDTLHTRIETDMHDPSTGTIPKLYRMLAIQMWSDHDYYDIQDTIALMRKYTTLPEEQEGVEIDWQSHISEFGDNLPNLTPAQHLMLIIELPLLTDEITTSHHTNIARTMLEMAGELGIDADSMRKEISAQHKAAQSAAKKAEKPKEKKAAEKSPSLPENETEAADELYDQAVEIVLKQRKASVSLVQRHLRIGYNRAARLIESMEKAGLVSAMQEDGGREVLAQAPKVRPAATWPFPTPGKLPEDAGN